MNRISDALELLTAQHEELDALLSMLSGSSPAIRAPSLAVLAEKVIAHLAAEEEVLYPALGSAIHTDVHAELVAEHAEIRRVVADLLDLQHEDVRFARKLVALERLVAVHAGWQEGDLFQRAAESKSPNELAMLGDRIHATISDPAVATAA